MELNKEEKSLLLYLETCAVDCSGAVDSRRMNKEDFDIAERWNKEGFINFCRIRFRYVGLGKTHCVVLSEGAWEMAHKERKARAARAYDKKTYQPATEEDEVQE